MSEPSPVALRKEIGVDLGAAQLAAWFRLRAADYPWRRGVREPYEILVCEFMAQQTQAPRVAIAFERWMERFPTIGSLASATRSDVLRAWQGLGYNRRAVALHETARAIVTEYGGQVPRDVETLRSFPGVGAYTAAAIASIAFGVPVAAIDTNIRRVTARVLHGLEPDELPPARLRADAQAWLDPTDPGAWNQAMMDVGASLCRPRAPHCGECPLTDVCEFRRLGRVGRSSVRRQPAFEGSVRQIRGAIVRALAGVGSLPVEALSDLSGASHEQVDAAVDSMTTEGLLERTPDGHVRLRE